jgi:hypothetical protein
MTAQSVQTNVKISKVDTDNGIVFGWAILSKKAGEDYYDLQGDHIPSSVMVDASIDFALNSRVAKEMHEGEARGSILFSFPMTADIAKAYGFDTGGDEGLMVAAKFEPDVVAKFDRGEYTGFSIGGYGTYDE